MQDLPFFPTIPLPLLMSCLTKILAGVVSFAVPAVQDSEYLSPTMVVFFFYRCVISTQQTDSINVLKEHLDL